MEQQFEADNELDKAVSNHKSLDREETKVSNQVFKEGKKK
jgi:hypothetical protein